MASLVAVRRCRDYEPDELAREIGAAVAAVADLPALVGGKRVALKINLLSEAPAEKAVCTHPALTLAVARLCRAAGAAEVFIADMPGMHLTDRPEVAFAQSGYTDMAADEKVAIVPFSRAGYREVPVRAPLKLKTLMYANALLDADVVINLPKLKSHLLANYTGAIKNYFGAVANRDRVKAHHLTDLAAFSAALVDIFSVRPPELTIMDAVVGMEGRGPSEGTPRRLGLVLASTDAVALDTVALACAGWSGMNVPQTRMAAELGLGEADLANITIDGPPLDAVRGAFALPPKAVVTPPAFMAKALYRLWRIRPKILVDKCEVCGACERVCPVGAIRMTEASAVIDHGVCIECFCCHEICPHSAIGEKMTPLYRLHRALRR